MNTVSTKAPSPRHLPQGLKGPKFPGGRAGTGRTFRTIWTVSRQALVTAAQSPASLRLALRAPNSTLRLPQLGYSTMRTDQPALEPPRAGHGVVNKHRWAKARATGFQRRRPGADREVESVP